MCRHCRHILKALSLRDGYTDADDGGGRKNAQVPEGREGDGVPGFSRERRSDEAQDGPIGIRPRRSGCYALLPWWKRIKDWFGANEFEKWAIHVSAHKSRI